MTTPELRAALFDLDGVLLDSEPLYTRAIQTIAGRFGKTYDWSLKQHTMGRDARVSARIIIEGLELPLSVDELLEERQPLLEALFENCDEMPGAERFVRALSARGVQLAVATSSERKLFDQKTKRHAWFECFGAIVCGDDPRVREKKPAPDIFLVAARALGVAPAACVVFEDSPAGVQAALAAGMRVIALPDPAMDGAHYARAHRVARGFDELGWPLLGE